MTAKTFKGRDGKWRAEQTIELGNNLVLSISSFRSARGFVCNASVSKRDGIFLTHAVYQDYHRTLGLADLRATEKNVATFHRECVDRFGLDNVIAEARCKHAEQLQGSEHAQPV